MVQDNVLVLSKAKVLGVHTNMDRITDAGTAVRAGKACLFFREKD